jgi:hypothetical protein
MSKKQRSAGRGPKKLEFEEALIALFIAAMNANDRVAPEELARAQHLIHSPNSSGGSQARPSAGSSIG